MLNCNHCGASVNYGWQMADHLKKEHNLTVAYGSELFKHKCRACGFSYRHMLSLRTHLEFMHGFVSGEVFFETQTYEDFKKWVRKTYQGKTYKYLCERSAKRKSETEPGKFVIYKCNGGNKIRGAPVDLTKRGVCTSEIEVFISEETGRCRVKFYQSHYGHAIRAVIPDEPASDNPDEPEAGPSGI